MGWFDFMRCDAKPNCSAARLAEDAFCSLSFEMGFWRRDEQVLGAVLAFLEDRASATAPTEELKKLRAVLESSQPTEAAVRAWFMRNFP